MPRCDNAARLCCLYLPVAAATRRLLCREIHQPPLGNPQRIFSVSSGSPWADRAQTTRPEALRVGCAVAMRGFLELRMRGLRALRLFLLMMWSANVVSPFTLSAASDTNLTTLLLVKLSTGNPWTGCNRTVATSKALLDSGKVNGDSPQAEHCMPKPLAFRRFFWIPSRRSILVQAAPRHWVLATMAQVRSGRSHRTERHCSHCSCHYAWTSNLKCVERYQT